MNDFEEIAYTAEDSFGGFIDNLIDHKPELVLKYNINREMKLEYVEGVLLQYWSNEALNEIELLEYMKHAYASRVK